MRLAVPKRGPMRKWEADSKHSGSMHTQIPGQYPVLPCGLHLVGATLGPGPMCRLAMQGGANQIPGYDQSGAEMS